MDHPDVVRLREVLASTGTAFTDWQREVLDRVMDAERVALHIPHRQGVTALRGFDEVDVMIFDEARLLGEPS